MAPSASIRCAVDITTLFISRLHITSLNWPVPLHSNKAQLYEDVFLYNKKTLFLCYISSPSFQGSVICLNLLHTSISQGFSLSITSLLSAGEELHSRGINHRLWLAAHYCTQRGFSTQITNTAYKHGSKKLKTCHINIEKSTFALHSIMNIYTQFCNKDRAQQYK